MNRKVPVPLFCCTIFYGEQSENRHLFFYPWRKDGYYHAEHKTYVQYGHNKVWTPPQQRGSVSVRIFRHGTGYLGKSVPSDKAMAHTGSVKRVRKKVSVFQNRRAYPKGNGSFPGDEPFFYSQLFSLHWCPADSIPGFQPGGTGSNPVWGSDGKAGTSHQFKIS